MPSRSMDRLNTVVVVGYDLVLWNKLVETFRSAALIFYPVHSSSINRSVRAQS